MKKAALAAAGVLLLIALAACGSGTSAPKLDKEGKKVAAAMATTLQSGGLSSKEATCLSTDFVGSVGVATLKKDKLITATGTFAPNGSPLSQDVAGKFVDAYLGCVDYAANTAKQATQFNPKLDSTKLKACVKSKMSNSYVKKVLVADLTQDPSHTKLDADSQTLLQGCEKQALGQ